MARSNAVLSQLPESWELMDYIRQRFGRGIIMRLLGCSERQAYRYCQSPDVAASQKRTHDPIENTEALLEVLLIGGTDADRDMALCLVLRLAERLGMRLSPIGEEEPDKDCLLSECLDDHMALAKFHEAARMWRLQEAVVLRAALDKELEQTMKALRKEAEKA